MAVSTHLKCLEVGGERGGGKKRRGQIKSEGCSIVVRNPVQDMRLRLEVLDNKMSRCSPEEVCVYICGNSQQI